MNTKQALVLRVKYPDGNGGTRKVRAGKLVAQACHASMQFLLVRLPLDSPVYAPAFSEAQEDWMGGDFTKVVTQVDTEEELLTLKAQAEAAGLEAHLITDLGKTEFGGVSTVTALAIGPDEAEKVDAITGHLKLY